MGLFSSLFGGSKKIDYSQMIPDPPRFSLADGSLGQYTGGLQQLIDVFNQQSQGQGLFDALQYIYGPQETALNQQYGINTNPGDIYSQRTGILPKTLASMNSRGLLDTGTSGIIEAQLRSNLANQNSQNYGAAKQIQSQQQQDALSALNQLFPQRFQAQNIQSQVDYDNAMNQYNTLLNRNAATVGQQQSMQANKNSAIDSLFGLGLGALGGAASGAGLFGSFGKIGGGGARGAMAGALGNITGSYSPVQQYALQNIFGNNKNNQNPGNYSSPFLSNNQNSGGSLSNSRLNSYYPY